MTLLVLGSNGSGKSLYAEKLTAKLCTDGCAPYYIASMIPYGAQGHARVSRHRKQRRALGFITKEQPFHVSGISLPTGAVVLLEDVSNLLSNVMFDPKRQTCNDDVLADITDLCAKCRYAVLVSIDGLQPDAAYDAQTNRYIDALNTLNHQLSVYADVVITMCEGKPLLRKGDVHALD